MRWVKSAGGPLVMIERVWAPLWQGISGNSLPSNQARKDETTDYERACQIKDYVGVVPMNEKRAIVLGDIPLATTAWNDDRTGAVVARVFYIDPGTDVRRLVSHANESDFGNAIESIEVIIDDDDIVIFDSALAGKKSDAADSTSISVPAGANRILTHEFRPDASTSLLMHFFRRLA